MDSNAASDGCVAAEHRDPLDGFPMSVAPPKNSGLSALKQFGPITCNAHWKALIGVSMVLGGHTPIALIPDFITSNN